METEACPANNLETACLQSSNRDHEGFQQGLLPTSRRPPVPAKQAAG